MNDRSAASVVELCVRSLQMLEEATVQAVEKGQQLYDGMRSFVLFASCLIAMDVLALLVGLLFHGEAWATVPYLLVTIAPWVGMILVACFLRPVAALSASSILAHRAIGLLSESIAGFKFGAGVVISALVSLLVSTSFEESGYVGLHVISLKILATTLLCLVPVFVVGISIQVAVDMIRNDRRDRAAAADELVSRLVHYAPFVKPVRALIGQLLNTCLKSWARIILLSLKGSLGLITAVGAVCDSLLS